MKRIENKVDDHVYLLGEDEISREEHEYYLQTQHYPIRLEPYFFKWVKSQDSSLTQKELAHKWRFLEDEVHDLLLSLLVEQHLSMVFNNQVESYVAYMAASSKQLQQVFDREVRQPLLQFLHENTNVGQVDITVQQEGRLTIQWAFES